MDYVCKVVGELSIEEKEFKLRMTFNEIIDLSPDDFKVSPRLRAALRNREIEVYTPTLHKQAKRLKIRKKMEVLKERIIPLKGPAPKLNPNFESSDITEMKAILGSISNKMTAVVSRLDLMITKVIESNNTLNANFSKFFAEKQSVQVNYDNPKLDTVLEQVASTQEKFNTYLQDQQRMQINQKDQPTDAKTTSMNEDKLDKLLSSVERLLVEGIKIDGKNINSQNTNGGGYSKIDNEKRVQYDEDLPVYVPTLETAVSQKNIVTEAIESEGTDNILEKLKKFK